MNKRLASTSAGAWGYRSALHERMAAKLVQVSALRPLADTKQDYPALPVTERAPVAGDFLAAVERLVRLP